jgi:hypothetical protein
MGCAVVLPGAFLLAYLLKKGLDAIATTGGPRAQSLEYGLIAIWILALAMTSHTHFSGRETLKRRYLRGAGERRGRGPGRSRRWAPRATGVGTTRGSRS